MLINDKYKPDSLPKIRDMIVAILHESGFTIMPEQHDCTFKDLGIDSLDHASLIVAVETKFDIEIPDFIAAELNSINDFTDYLTKVAKDYTDFVNKSL